MNKTKTWLCDHCEQEIKRPEDGYVEWLIYEENGVWKGRGLRLVHHVTASPLRRGRGEYGCQYVAERERARDGSILMDNSLEKFLGPDGLMCLLLFLHEGLLPQESLVEMIKRLHIPGYEHARFYFDDAIAEDVFEPNRPSHFHHTFDIEDTLKFAKAQEKAAPSW